MAKTPMNTNITDDDANASGINANVINTSTLSSTATPPVTGNALLVHTPYISRKITGTANNPVTIYQTVPASGQISSTDDGMLCIAPIYASHAGIQVPLETSYTSEDGQRLKVDAAITSGSISSVAEKYIPRAYYSTTAISFASGVESSLFLYTGVGKIDEIVVNTNYTTFEIILKVDGVIVYTIPTNSIYTILMLGNNQYGNVNNYTYGYNGGYGFVDIYPTPIDFSTSFEVRAHNTGTGGTARSVTGQMIRYRIGS